MAENIVQEVPGIPIEEEPAVPQEEEKPQVEPDAQPEVPPNEHPRRNIVKNVLIGGAVAVGVGIALPYAAAGVLAYGGFTATGM